MSRFVTRARPSFTMVRLIGGGGIDHVDRTTSYQHLWTKCSELQNVSLPLRALKQFRGILQRTFQARWRDSGTEWRESSEKEGVRRQINHAAAVTSIEMFSPISVCKGIDRKREMQVTTRLLTCKGRSSKVSICDLSMNDDGKIVSSQSKMSTARRSELAVFIALTEEWRSSEKQQKEWEDWNSECWPKNESQSSQAGREEGGKNISRFFDLN